LWTGRRIVWRGGWFGDRHVEAGGWFVHSALTVPHRRRESLSVVLERLRLVWRGLRHLRVLRRWRALASVSPLVVLQVLWGRDGWHPHFHVLWFGSGDVDRLGFAADVDAGWLARCRSVGLRPSKRAARTGLVSDHYRWLEYVTSGDARFEYSDCLAPDHGGCDQCDRGQVGGWVLGDGSGLGDEALERSGEGLEVWAGLGVAGVDGDRTAQALVAEYVKSTPRVNRVSSVSELVRRFGSPPARPRFVRSSDDSGGLFVSSGVVGAVELNPHFERRSPLAEGFALASAGDVDGAADLWSQVVGRRVVVDVAVGDGCPLLRFEGEQVGTETKDGSGMSDTAVIGLNGSDEPRVERPSMSPRLAVVLGVFEDADELASALELAENEPRANSKEREGFDRIIGFHGLVVGSGDPELCRRWADLLTGHIERTKSFAGRAWDWIVEAEAAANG
jgi:hypothetical protein